MKINNYIVRVYSNQGKLLDSIRFRAPAGLSCRIGLCEVFTHGYHANNTRTETFQEFDDGTTELVDPDAEMVF